ncbi:MAG TPA: hypothetical protein PKA86_05585, partial [Bacteroidia bacterium]|nr:hypothetical protein [Bacteroidia bacterium]
VGSPPVVDHSGYFFSQKFYNMTCPEINLHRISVKHGEKSHLKEKRIIEIFLKNYYRKSSAIVNLYRSKNEL